MTTPTAPTTQPGMPRRSFFAWLTALAGALATVALAVPFVGYLLGPLRRKEPPWQPLGPIGKFPLNETVLATFDSPLRQPWDGRAAHTGVYVRYLGQEDGQEQFLVLAMNCA